MAEKCHYNKFLNEFFGGLIIQLFPLGKAHKAHFSTSMCYNESWEASTPIMCLYHMPYPLNQIPHVSQNNVGHLELKNLSTHAEAGCKKCSMYNTRYMSHINYIEHLQLNRSFVFVKIIVRRFASHIFNTFNTKWRQVKPNRGQEKSSNLNFSLSKVPFLDMY